MFRKSIGIIAATAALGATRGLTFPTTIEITPGPDPEPDPPKRKKKLIQKAASLKDPYAKIKQQRLEVKNKRRAINGLAPLTCYSQV